MQPPVRWRAPRRTVSSPPSETSPKIAVSRVSVAGPAGAGDLAALHGGITAGPTGGPWQGELPRYVWSRHGDRVQEFRLADPEKGSYTVYELHPSEWPEGLE
jgi:hypothetical protein